MACEQWKESLVARLYDELDPDEARALSGHLESCGSCRDALDELAAARELLREAEPVAPLAPRVVMLNPPRPRPSYLAFAAGFAVAALLAGAGMLGGWMIASGAPGAADPGLASQPRPAGIPGTVDPAGAAVPREVLASIRERLDEQDGRIQALQASGGEPGLTRSDFDGGLVRLQNEINRQRSEDLQLLLREIAGVELRTGERIGQTQDALRYVMLASDPVMTSQ